MTDTATDGVGEGFSKTAADYDDAVRFNIAGAQRLIASIPAGEYRDVLDVGCGTGFSAVAMADRFGPLRLTGVDASEGMLEQFEAKLAGRPDIEATLHAADVLDMPVPDGAFDAVICSMAFHWFPFKGRAMAAMARALKPGGVIAILCSGSGGEGEFQHLLARLEPGVPGWVGAFDTLQRDIPDMEGYLAHAGLEPLDVWMERRIRRADPVAYMERMRVVAGHITAGAGEEEREDLERRVEEALAAAVDADGRFEYTFTKLFTIARRP
ncbi:MAG: class I SAM-dependent methyltransferase [Thermoleophilia bacterium]|jgi:ubiquinone/menaquinone biosynthesis C-methylase UbiE